MNVCAHLGSVSACAYTCAVRGRVCVTVPINEYTGMVP